ncbi:MAG: hypothetical protein ACRYGM_08970 [Janthinobacterium lividum]
MTTEYLPNGTAIVTLGDEPVWTPLQVFTWVAYRERRTGLELSEIVFPRSQWSRDWRNWPTHGLASALREIATGQPWQPIPDSFEDGFVENDRAWARNIIELTGEDARALVDAVEADRERARLAHTEYLNAKAAVHAALCDGHLQVWARRAHGCMRPNHEAASELLPQRWFTHQPREVDESDWVQGSGNDYKGPWWFEARFDAHKVLALWPAGIGIGPCIPAPVPFPDAHHVSPWVAACWRAFGTLDGPIHIESNRSFNNGADRLPDESDTSYASRQDEHRRFDAAEREIFELLGSGRVTALGRPPATKDGRQIPYAAARAFISIPSSTFLNRELAFSQCAELVSRLPILEQEFDRQDLHGSDADPRFPLFYDITVESAGLQTAWTIESPTTEAAAPSDYSTGLAGRQTSRHLALEEMKRRAQSGELKSSLTAECKHLAAWLIDKHPKAPNPAAKALANFLRDKYRLLNPRLK